MLAANGSSDKATLGDHSPVGCPATPTFLSHPHEHNTSLAVITTGYMIVYMSCFLEAVSADPMYPGVWYSCNRC